MALTYDLKYWNRYMLTKQQEEHTKSQICYNRLETQKNLKTHVLNNLKELLLFSLRSRMAKQFKANFPYNSDQTWPKEGCGEVDTQEHCLECAKAYPSNSTQSNPMEYHGIFSEDTIKQVAIIKLFASLLEKREDASAYTAGPMCCPGSREEGGVQWSMFSHD